MIEEKLNGIQISYLDFDIYSKSLGFFYKDKEKIGSLFGFILTIIYILISSFLFIFYTILTINKSDIKVHDSVLYQKEAPEMNVNSDLFYFAFGVENNLTGYTRFIDETIYFPKVFYVNKIKEGSTFKLLEERPLNIERCISEKFGKDYQDLLVKDELNNSYCLSSFNLTLSGNFKYNKLSYIKINVYPCVNTTENNNHCKPKEVIDSFLSGTFISVLVKDIGLEPSNYSYPVVPQFQDLYVSIDKSYFRDFTLYFGITEIQTDVGLFYEKILKKRYMNFMKTAQGLYYRDKENYYNGDSMCEVKLRMGDDIRIQKRTYRKMSEVFVITGGYMQLISTIFSIITFLTNKIDHEVQLVNALFNFYPKNRKICLKHYIEKLSLDSNININRDNTFQKMKNSNLYFDNKSNSIYDANKNSFIKENNNDNLIQSISIINNQKKKNGKLNENIINKINNKNDKDSFNDENNNNKSKISFLTFGIDNNYPKKRKSIFNKNIVIKKINSLNNKFENSEGQKIYLKFNSFYYYCFSKFKHEKKTKEIMKLFNFAISFFKKKMDIVYLFHIILLFEKELGRKKGNFIPEDETFFQLNDN